MYSVFRLLPDAANAVAVAEHAAQMDNCGGLFEFVPMKGIARGAFVTSLADDDDWDGHEANLLLFLRRNHRVLSAARETGIGLQVDVALDQLDIPSGALCADMRLSLEALAALVAVGVEVVVTLYPHGSATWRRWQRAKAMARRFSSAGSTSPG